MSTGLVLNKKSFSSRTCTTIQHTILSHWWSWWSLSHIIVLSWKICKTWLMTLYFSTKHCMETCRNSLIFPFGSVFGFWWPQLWMPLKSHSAEDISITDTSPKAIIDHHGSGRSPGLQKQHCELCHRHDKVSKVQTFVRERKHSMDTWPQKSPEKIRWSASITGK